MTRRRDIVHLLTTEPRSVSSLARELGLRRGDAASELEHALRSAKAAGLTIVVEPAVCKDCGFEFSTDKLTKPGKCPSCRGSRILEAQVRLQ